MINSMVGTETLLHHTIFHVFYFIMPFVPLFESLYVYLCSKLLIVYFCTSDSETDASAGVFYLKSNTHGKKQYNKHTLDRHEIYTSMTRYNATQYTIHTPDDERYTNVT